MNKCLKRLGRECVKISVVLVMVGLMALLYILWEDSSRAINTNLWMQSTEERLRQQNDNYYNEIYDRYSRIHRDLNDYQYMTNRRLESLESRVNRIEKSFARENISINQTQINGAKNEHEN